MDLKQLEKIQRKTEETKKENDRMKESIRGKNKELGFMNTTFSALNQQSPAFGQDPGVRQVWTSPADQQSFGFIQQGSWSSQHGFGNLPGFGSLRQDFGHSQPDFGHWRPENPSNELVLDLD